MFALETALAPELIFVKCIQHRHLSNVKFQDLKLVPTESGHTATSQLGPLVMMAMPRQTLIHAKTMEPATE